MDVDDDNICGKEFLCIVIVFGNVNIIICMHCIKNNDLFYLEKNVKVEFENHCCSCVEMQMSYLFIFSLEVYSRKICLMSSLFGFRE